MGFLYDAAWLLFPHAVPLSRTMPLREEEYKGAEVNHYFDNLLPENPVTRQRLARSSHAESASVFDLLSRPWQRVRGRISISVRSGSSPPSLGRTGQSRVGCLDRRAARRA